MSHVNFVLLRRSGQMNPPFELFALGRIQLNAAHSVLVGSTVADSSSGASNLETRNMIDSVVLTV
jgi:hypothetical protein